MPCAALLQTLGQHIVIAKRHVSFGSKADVTAFNFDVRFVPIATAARQQTTSPFDHFVDG